MTGIIIYKTACGSTKQYADWISEETGFEPIPITDAKKIDLTSYDVVIVGSLVIAKRMTAGKWITGKWDVLKGKTIVLFSTSGVTPDDKVKEEFLRNSVPPEIAQQIAYFPMHGRRRQKDLSPVAKLMMWIAATFIAKTPQEKEEMRKDFDGVDRSYIAPLVDYVKKSEQEN
jgi:menaquinone-dependent protoporphyrinogen IX oxidase